MLDQNKEQIQVRPSALALLPLGVFLALFIGVGVYFTLQGVEFAFYQLSAPVAALPAIILAVLLSREKLNKAIEQFIAGAGHGDIMVMSMIFLLAGAFAAVVSATGGVDATVNLGLSLISSQFILPGIFIISAFISTAMGTSMGTIGAVAPVAVGIAQAAGLDLGLTAGAVMSGAMFGDNLSIISDTTIAATRSQGCGMKDKFRENIFIAAPAALVAIVVFFFANTSAEVPETGAIEWLKVLPYIAILVLAVAGVNVFVVLGLGVILAGGVGFVSVADYSLAGYAKDIYKGFTHVQEIFILAMLIGGMSELMRRQGGLVFIIGVIEKLVGGAGKSGTTRRGGEFGIAGLVSAINVCVASNTVAIIVSGGVARELAEKSGVGGKRAASILDIFSCVLQGILPYGGQALLLGSVFKLSPLEIVGHSYYCFLLAISAILAIFVKNRK